MNYVRTFMLMAGLTALFGAVGYLLGGTGGMLIALAIAAATNLYSYWNSDKLALAAYNAQQVDERSAPELYGMGAGSGGAGQHADAARLPDPGRPAQCLRHRPKP